MNDQQLDCMQVVMGYGHNKLSLEEAEELLKEVNSIRFFFWLISHPAGRLGWRWEARLHRVYTDDALGLGGLAVNTWRTSSTM